MNFLKVTSLALLVVLSSNVQATDIDNNNLVAKMTIDTKSMFLQVVKLSDDLTEEQKTCIDNIDMQSQVNVVEKSMESYFDKVELKEINDFYAKPAVRKMVDASRQHMFSHMGLQFAKKSPEFSKEEFEMIEQAFTNSPTLQKYLIYNSSDKASSFNKSVDDFMNTELKNVVFQKVKSQNNCFLCNSN